jgi:hypothetical protein
MQPEYRLYEMNKRLANRPEPDFIEWWEGFSNEFFENDAKLCIQNVSDEEGTHNFVINRPLIPRYFKSIFEGGITDMYYHLARGGQISTANIIVQQRQPLQNEQQSINEPVPVINKQQTIIIFETDACTMVNLHLFFC